MLKFKVGYKTRWGENLFLRSGERSWAMEYEAGELWSAEIDENELFGDEDNVEYYYEVRTDGIPTRHEWRAHSLSRGAAGEIADSWSDIPGWKGAGTAVPVFALRSGDDFGVGEFLDLAKLVDWAAATGQSVIQILPINDTTMTGEWMDSYPYNANSTFALHPQFINLQAAGIVPDEEFVKLQKELNGLEKIDYVRVNEAKNAYLHKAFEADWSKVCKRKAYRKFLSANRYWLLPYAAFSVLRDIYGTAEFSKWEDMAVYDEGKVEAFCKKHKKEVDFYCFVQYHLDAQLRQVRNYAHSKGVILKGDLPIGISRTSVDAWQYPQLFNMDSQAGAPPDAFSADGQNWGFPTYNWDEMAKDGYAWWTSRLRKMNEYFDALRLDHILGFFRIWESPVPQKSGLEGHFSPALPYSGEELRNWGYGDRMHCFVEDPRRPGWYHPRINAQRELGGLYYDYFYHRHNEFWKNTAITKLAALLGSSNMLTCGEDLGMIPACVPDVMAKMNILSLEVQRMPKNPDETFANPACYPYNCVCTTSTHDMSPIRAWWEEDRALSQRFFNEMLGFSGAAPYFCEDWVCKKIVSQHLHSPAMLVILPLQDWLSMSAELRYQGNPADERINVPAICPYYWRYRMHISLEDLLAADAFNADIAALIRDSHRG